jgi:hypothetical protein
MYSPRILSVNPITIPSASGRTIGTSRALDGHDSPNPSVSLRKLSWLTWFIEAAPGLRASGAGGLKARDVCYARFFNRLASDRSAQRFTKPVSVAWSSAILVKLALRSVAFMSAAKLIVGIGSAQMVSWYSCTPDPLGGHGPS